MISLDQVQLLEKKVESIVSKMNDLQRLNSELKEKNSLLTEKNTLLMEKISAFEADQSRIEEGILNALDRLNSMENTVLSSGSNAPIQEQKVVETPAESSIEETHSEETHSTVTETEQSQDSSSDLGLNFDFDSSLNNEETDKGQPDIF